MGLFKWFLVGLLSAMLYLMVSVYKADYKSPSFNDLTKEQQDWFRKGNSISVNGYKMFYRFKRPSNPSHAAVIFVHGFPSSSFDYHKSFDLLDRPGGVLVFDHVGFGFSDKPNINFSYSIIEHADQALMLWRALNISTAHLIAHDMGDSIVTEILNRRRLQLLPPPFDNFLRSVTFTNGGMMVEHIGFRLSQRLLLLPYVGKALTRLNAALRIESFTHQQLASIWGHSEAGRSARDKDIADLIALNTYRGGNLLMHKMIHYLRDRFVFEPRWLRAVQELDVPCRILWGDSDAVAPVAIATNLHRLAPHCELKFMKTVGHFLMLESPQEWLKLAVIQTES